MIILDLPPELRGIQCGQPYLFTFNVSVQNEQSVVQCCFEIQEPETCGCHFLVLDEVSGVEEKQAKICLPKLTLRATDGPVALEVKVIMECNFHGDTRVCSIKATATDDEGDSVGDTIPAFVSC